MKPFGRTFFFLLSIVSVSLSAQDTRSVKEPVLPPVCTTLKSALTTASATSGEIETRADKSGPANSGLDTARIQSALNHCDKGHAVELAPNAANTAFLTGPILLRPGVALLLDKAVTLYATRNPEAYALTPGSCGLVNDAPTGCRPLITVLHATSSAIMGDGVIDGQGGSPLIVDGKPTTKSWFDLGDDARTVGRAQSPRLIDADLSDDFTLYRITLRNAPNLHVSFHRGEGFTVWGIRIDTPKSARNTDGIVVEQARNITIAQSFLRTGDNNIAIKAGDGPTTGITLQHNHLYWGRGLNLGDDTTAGVSQMRVQDLSIDGAENGLRIRSNAGHGGLVEDVIYDDVCIRNAKSPILFDAAFSFPGKANTTLPVYRDIGLRNVRISGGGKIQLNGFDATHRIAVTFDGVLLLDSPDHYRAQTIHADVTFGPGPVNVVFTGDDSTANGKEVRGSLPGCSEKFVPFP